MWWLVHDALAELSNVWFDVHSAVTSQTLVLVLHRGFVQEEVVQKPGSSVLAGSCLCNFDFHQAAIPA
jgi:hypothetical protein